MARSPDRLRPAVVHPLATRQWKASLQGHCHPAWSALATFQRILVQAIRPLPNSHYFCQSGDFGLHDGNHLHDDPPVCRFFHRHGRLSRFALFIWIFAVRRSWELQLRNSLYARSHPWYGACRSDDPRPERLSHPRWTYCMRRFRYLSGASADDQSGCCFGGCRCCLYRFRHRRLHRPSKRFAKERRTSALLRHGASARGGVFSIFSILSTGRTSGAGGGSGILCPLR